VTPIQVMTESGSVWYVYVLKKETSDGSRKDRKIEDHRLTIESLSTEIATQSDLLRLLQEENLLLRSALQKYHTSSSGGNSLLTFQSSPAVSVPPTLPSAVRLQPRLPWNDHHEDEIIRFDTDTPEEENPDRQQTFVCLNPDQAVISTYFFSRIHRQHLDSSVNFTGKRKVQGGLGRNIVRQLR